VALPLLVPADGAPPRVLGILAFTFGERRAFGPEEDDFMRAVADPCAQALERARLLAAEQVARREAEAANRAKGDFLATMSHELRTPLNAIAGHVELLEMGLHGPVTPAQVDALARVQRAQSHLLGLINDVLNYAKLEAGRVEYEARELDVVEVLQATLPLVEPQRLTKGILWGVEIPPAPCLVCGDRNKIGQVLLNLLSNAVKFTPEGGRINVRVAAASDGEAFARVEVRDTGIGIPADRLEAIFQPFVQVDASRARTHEGTGLGLTISRDLARGMGGDLTAASTPGVGSIFTLTLSAAARTAG
jgi:signal transduction histidine kinase